MASFSCLLTVLALFLGVIVWYYYRYFCLKRTLKNVGGPLPIPFLGNALMIKSRNAILPLFSKLFKTYGKMFLLLMGSEPLVIIADYKALENVLSSGKILSKSFQYRFFYNWLKGGLLLSSGKKWKSRRRILTPSYHFQILEQFVPIFNRVADVLIEQFQKEKNKDAVDVYSYITLCTLDVICETAMGVSVNAQVKKASPYVQSVKEMGKIFVDRSFGFLQQLDVTYRFTENYKKEQEALNILHGYTEKVIKRRREELNSCQGQEDEECTDDFGKKKRHAFLDLLLQVKDENDLPLSDADIREEVDTFMFEGHDTTSSGISFALYAIANNPDVQKKILMEQEEILQGEERDFTYNDLNRMKYLEMVIKETLRMYPSVPTYARQTTEDFHLTEDVIVPAGCTITIIPYEIHRDPEYFPDPETFRPERFLPENNLSKKPFSFIPFSAGSRNCIGQKFAYLEMKTVLSKVIRTFNISQTIPQHKLQLTVDTILKSDNGILIKINSRS